MPDQLPDIEGLALWFVAFLFSTTCHEAAHAWAAKRGGDNTAYLAGQVSLNPIPHIKREPIGMVVVPILAYLFGGFMLGWASAPYDPVWAARHRRRAGLMAAAGPIANLILAALAVVAIKMLVVTGWGMPPESARLDALLVPQLSDPLPLALAKLLSIMASLNALLGVFNLLPIPPLDGAAVVESFGGPAGRAMEWVRSFPMAGLIGLLAAWKIFGAIAGPILRVVLEATHPGIYG